MTFLIPRLSGKSHPVSFATADLCDDDLKMIVASKMDERHAALDVLLEAEIPPAI